MQVISASTLLVEQASALDSVLSFNSSCSSCISHLGGSIALKYCFHSGY